MTAPVEESDIKPITHSGSPTGVVLHIKEETKDLQNIEGAAFSTPSSPDHSPLSPLMEIIPPPLSHQLEVKTPLETATAVTSSNTNSTPTQGLQSLSEIQPTPCMLYPSWIFVAISNALVYSDWKSDRWRKKPCTRPPGLGRRPWIPSDFWRSPWINLSDLHWPQPASSRKFGVV